MITTEPILINVEYGVPSGNYDGSSLDWVSDAVQAANYYQGRGSTQTITFSVVGFVGIMHLEATLDLDPTSADTEWFETYAYGDGTNPLTDYHPATIRGNFTWLRIRVEGFEAGTIRDVIATF